MDALEIDPPFTKEEFLEWRTPRRGERNPHSMINPVWRWLIRTDTSSYSLNEAMGGPNSFGFKPCWSADRFGQSRTELQDARIVEIAGEHEDHYDPDFFIYNDTIVHHPDGEIEIFTYDVSNFPPTDFHSATLVGDEIWIVGNLGYTADRKPGETQVLVMDVAMLEVRRVETTGDNPGWIHRHEAVLKKDGASITVSGGEIDDGKDLVENIDDWSLDLGSKRWKRLTQRDWPHWIFTRKNGEFNELWEARQAEWKSDLQKISKREPSLDSEWEGDLGLLKSLYNPPVEFVPIPRSEEHEYNHFWIELDGVKVRYVEDSHQVSMLAFGELPEDKVTVLVDDLRTKLSRLEGLHYRARQLTKP